MLVVQAAQVFKSRAQPVAHLSTGSKNHEGVCVRMAHENVKTELERLVQQIEEQPRERHELYLTLREKLNELRAIGLPVPDDLASLERELQREFASRQ
jgi:hypothetical protein